MNTARWFRLGRCVVAVLTLNIVVPMGIGQSEGQTEGQTGGERFDADQLAQLAALGPWPEPFRPDPSNRYSGSAQAIRLGELLFNAPELSGPGTISCASCHNKTLAFSEARPTGFGVKPLGRNTPALMDLAGLRWYGWDGGTDSLWSASLRPLLAPEEMNSTLAIVAGFLRQQSQAHALGAIAPDDETTAVNAAKMIAAYLETLRSAPSAFDRFRTSLLTDPANPQSALAHMPAAAQRGLKLFLNNQCTACHNGPRLSNGEFHDIGIRFFLPAQAGEAARVDPGRFAGLQRLSQDRYTRLSPFSDANNREADGMATRTVTREHRNFGEWKTPSLRNLRLTAPYMHNGSLQTLHAVVRHYSRFDEDRVHADGEAILRPLYLSDQQINDLVAFLEIL